MNTQINDACAQGGTNDIVIVTAPQTSSTVNAYAIYGQLVSSPTKFFCIDSTGKTSQATGTPSGMITCN